MTRTIKLALVVAAIVVALAGSSQAGFQTQTFDWIMRSEFEDEPITFTGYLVLPFRGDGAGAPLNVVVLSTPQIIENTFGSIDGSLMSWNYGAGGSFTAKNGEIVAGGFNAIRNNGGLSFTSIELEAKSISEYFTLDFSVVGYFDALGRIGPLDTLVHKRSNWRHVDCRSGFRKEIDHAIRGDRVARNPR